MRLKELLEVVEVDSKLDLEVKDISLDSREVKDGTLYICLNKEYLTKEVLGKAIFILTSFKSSNKKTLFINNLENRYYQIIHHFFGNITNKIKVVGVTGTNGKTTISYSLYTLFNRLGYPSLYIGTLGGFYLNKEIILKNTTPSLITNLSLIQEAYKQGIEYVFMEVSSHALAQKRVEGINFYGAIYTNLTQDHLDYHKTFDNYALTKKSLFDNLRENSFAVFNVDDSYCSFMEKDCKAKKILYGISNNVNGIKKLNYREKIYFKFIDGTLKSSFIGKFNVYNLLAIYLTAKEILNEDRKILKQIKLLPCVKGRMEIIKHKSNLIIIDFAHSPDAFKKVFEEISTFKYKKLKVVFGCGGDRDKGKRPIMGKIADDYADVIFLTDDNARSENEQLILDQIKEGITHKEKIIEQINRQKAIEMALESLDKNEILLILGRGHESNLKIKDKSIPLNDKDVVTSWIQEH
ncbi:MAG: UDP-N-acetylmuramoyl-L-alanyl-D-glutamate--2,6-diaminopimelate ligase [Erysipelotrichaceae bacterium]|nr:UDP-N-acetylmuramoyl-L-alanyl-D-glutamate--2,6-diaminopimelate ligase [Erysipelotrichaceae bacterium]